MSKYENIEDVPEFSSVREENWQYQKWSITGPKEIVALLVNNKAENPTYRRLLVSKEGSHHMEFLGSWGWTHSTMKPEDQYDAYENCETLWIKPGFKYNPWGSK